MYKQPPVPDGTFGPKPSTHKDQEGYKQQQRQLWQQRQEEYGYHTQSPPMHYRQPPVHVHDQQGDTAPNDVYNNRPQRPQQQQQQSQWQQKEWQQQHQHQQQSVHYKQPSPTLGIKMYPPSNEIEVIQNELEHQQRPQWQQQQQQRRRRRQQRQQGSVVVESTYHQQPPQPPPMELKSPPMYHKQLPMHHQQPPMPKKETEQQRRWQRKQQQSQWQQSQWQQQHQHQQQSVHYKQPPPTLGIKMYPLSNEIEVIQNELEHQQRPQWQQQQQQQWRRRQQRQQHQQEYRPQFNVVAESTYQQQQHMPPPPSPMKLGLPYPPVRKRRFNRSITEGNEQESEEQVQPVPATPAQTPNFIENATTQSPANISQDTDQMSVVQEGNVLVSNTMITPPDYSFSGEDQQHRKYRRRRPGEGFDRKINTVLQKRWPNHTAEERRRDRLGL
jgi:hypothetical protein